GISLGGYLTDGIEGGEYANQYKPSGTLADATLQVENVRVGPLTGDSTQAHQDCIQQYGGWKDLRVDHFTCHTVYQGFFFPWEDGVANNQGVLSHWDLRNVNLYDGASNPAGYFQTLLHFGDRNGTFTATTHQQGGNLQNVYFNATQRSFAQETYPNPTCSCGPTYASTLNLNGTISWLSYGIPGVVNPGIPPGGDNIPPGVAGLGYHSPG